MEWKALDLRLEPAGLLARKTGGLKISVTHKILIKSQI